MPWQNILYKGQDNHLVKRCFCNRLSWGKAEASVVVTVRRVVPVTVSGARVPAVVDPGAAAQHTVRAYNDHPDTYI